MKAKHPRVTMSKAPCTMKSTSMRKKNSARGKILRNTRRAPLAIRRKPARSEDRSINTDSDADTGIGLCGLSSIMDGVTGGFGEAMSAKGRGTIRRQTFAMSSCADSNGKVHTEKYASSSVGNLGRRVAEKKEAYSNSSTGVEKIALKRRLGSRGHKMVTEVNRSTGERHTKDTVVGMDESCKQEFDFKFKKKARYLPPHVEGLGMLANESGSRATKTKALKDR